MVEQTVQNVYNGRFKIFMGEQNVHDKLNVQIIHGWTKCSKCSRQKVQNIYGWTKCSKCSWLNKRFKMFMAKQNVQKIHFWTTCSKCLWLNKMSKMSMFEQNILLKFSIGMSKMANTEWIDVDVMLPLFVISL